MGQHSRMEWGKIRRKKTLKYFWTSFLCDPNGMVHPSRLAVGAVAPAADNEWRGRLTLLQKGRGEGFRCKRERAKLQATPTRRLPICRDRRWMVGLMTMRCSSPCGASSTKSGHLGMSTASVEVASQSAWVDEKPSAQQTRGKC